MTDDHTVLLRGLLAAVTDLSALPHSGQVGRVLLAAAVAGRGCLDDEVAFNALMPVAAVRQILPSRLERCQHVPALLAAKATFAPRGAIIFSGIRLTGEAERRSRDAAMHLSGCHGRHQSRMCLMHLSCHRDQPSRSPPRGQGVRCCRSSALPRASFDGGGEDCQTGLQQIRGLSGGSMNDPSIRTGASKWYAARCCTPRAI